MCECVWDDVILLSAASHKSKPETGRARQSPTGSPGWGSMLQRGVDQFLSVSER